MHRKYSKVVITSESNLVICLHRMKEVIDITSLKRLDFIKIEKEREERERKEERKDKPVSLQDLSLCFETCRQQSLALNPFDNS